MERCGLDSPDYVMRRAKMLIRDSVEGRHWDSYASLPKSIEKIKAKNPESFVHAYS